MSRPNSSGEPTGLEALALLVGGSVAPDHTRSRNSIMIVDDNPSNLKLLEDMLRPHRFEVRSFPLGRLALAAAAEEPPDLILLDINMPEMDGFEVCRRLRANVALASIPVIFLSALNETKDKLAAFRSGGLDFITKPFEPEEVHARIELQLELRELRAKVERHNQDLERLVRQQVREIAEGQMATIFALAKLADSRDVETGKHLERVQVLCRLLAIELSASPNYAGTITERYVENIFCASPLHDIGKVAIPDAILLKAGELTDEEFAIMKTHTTHGAKTLELVLERHPANAFVRMGIEIARSHHEMWDGAGYPDGLAGLAIPVSARIMAVADCYDAMRSRRKYKEPFSHEESRDLIVSGSGHHFEPEMVNAFCKIQESFRQVSDRIT